MKKNLSFYNVTCHIWPQIWYLIFLNVKIQYKPIENYHMENAILGNDFNLGVIGSFFHVFTQMISLIWFKS